MRSEVFRLLDRDGALVMEAEHVEMWAGWPARIVEPQGDLEALYRRHRISTWFMKWYWPKEGDGIPYSANLFLGSRLLSPVSGLYLAVEWLGRREGGQEQITLSRYSLSMSSLDLDNPGGDRRQRASPQADSLGRRQLPLSSEHVFLGYTDPRNPLEPLWTS